MGRRKPLFWSFCLAALLGACGAREPDVGNMPFLKLEPDNAALVASGKDIYVQDCASCHGVNLEGQPDWRIRNPQGFLPAPPHDPSGHTWHHTDQVLFDLTKFGPQKYAGADYKSDMPAYETTLSDDEIIAVLSYIKSQWPEKIRKRHDAMNAQNEALQEQLDKD